MVEFEALFQIKGIDGDDLGIKNTLDFIANQVVNRLHVQLRGQACLHTVDDRQFGIALFGLFEQAGGLIEKAYVLYGDGGLVCKCGEQGDLSLRERFYLVAADNDCTGRVALAH